VNETEPRNDTVVKIYVTDRPRFLGLFHWGPTAEGAPGAIRRAGFAGVIGQVGPCRCGDPSHTFPRWYSMTPCVYVHVFGKILTCRIPGWLCSALLWLKGNSEV
jgi:hypothetical protein